MEEHFPQKLYHATSIKNTDKIEKNGISYNVDRKWNISKKDVTYWAETPIGAALYVRMKGIKVNDIVIYEAPLSAFDTKKLQPDRNYPENARSGSYEYNGNMPATQLRRISDKEWR